MKKLLITGLLSLGLVHAAQAAGGETAKVKNVDFTFEGPFGYYDQAQLQRGLQIFTEVCSACHGLRYVGFYSLDDEGGPALPEDQARAYAAQYTVFDERTQEDRPATYADHFPPNTALNAPDLSLMAKARAGFHGPYGLGINQLFKGQGGPEYIYNFLTGFTGEEKEEGGSVFYHNPYFPGGYTAMPPQLDDGSVDYALEDASFETNSQYAMDVTAFLMWAAEPHLEARNRGGFIWFLMFAGIGVTLWFANKLLWRPIKHPEEH